MSKIHSALVTAYLLGGLTLMATTPWSSLTGMLSNSGGATLQIEALHGSAGDESMVLTRAAVQSAERANASRQLMLGILMFTLGGFVHAYAVSRNERPVKITAKKRKQKLLYWLEMRI